MNIAENLRTVDEANGESETCNSSSGQLVVYDENSVLPHYKPSKEFSFNDSIHITIKQNWAQQGVAGVVWDAGTCTEIEMYRVSLRNWESHRDSVSEFGRDIVSIIDDVYNQYKQQAIVFCEYLVLHPEMVAGKNILEIGAGTGLVGMCSSKLGGITTLTDREDSLSILRENIDLNFPDKSPTLAPLDWSIHSACRDLLQRRWDWVFGADIIYIEESFPSLLKTMETLQWNKLMLAARLRYPKDHRFIDECKVVFYIKEIFYDRNKDIHLYLFTGKKA